MAKHSMNSPEDPESGQSGMDARILLALETAPQLEIPAGFAARLAASLPPPPATVAQQRHGRNAAIVCIAILLGLIFAFARGSAVPTSLVWIVVESIFCIQFALIAVWLAVRKTWLDFGWFS